MITIGRKDKITLPEFDLIHLEAKIDTGAYGCALHCHHVEVVKNNGTEMLSFQLLDPTHPEYEDKTYFTDKFNEKVVKNSGGYAEHRYTIETEVVIFGQSRITQFSLTDRKNMKYPVLLGRTFLRGEFLVDVNKKNISFKLKVNKK